MITVEQIRGARGLLSWSQQDLADKSGVSKPTINNIERFMLVPRVKTMDKIEQAFVENGVEFIAGPGVRFSAQNLNVKVFTGSEALIRLVDDMYISLKECKNKEILCSGADEKRLYDVGGEKFVKLIERNQKSGVTAKILLKEGDTYFLEPKKFYRWCGKETHQQVAYHVYGDTYAMLLWGPPIKIVLIRNAQIAEDYRKQFLFNWDNAKIIP
jgi:transcriptional regulator with XRE-family HTH domain